MSFGVDFATGLVVVDVGWKGSIQNNIYHALQNNISVHGYYIGLLSPTGLTGNNTKTGIVFSDFPDHTPFVHVYNNNRSLFEMLLGASHGSANGYFATNSDDAIAARKSTLTKHIDGKTAYGVATLDLPEERKLYNIKIYPLQQQFLKMFTAATKIYAKTEAEVPDARWFARHHSRMVFKPSKDEVQFFSELYHLENFGIFEFTDFNSKNNPGLRQRVHNLLHLVKTPAAYLETESGRL